MPVHSSTVSESCVPGVNGVPHSLLGKLICGAWVPHDQATWLQLADRWPYAAAITAVALVAAVGWQVARRRAWAGHIRAATFLEIVPPVGVCAADTAQLWKLLAEIMPSPRRFTLHPQRLLFEVCANVGRMRLGILVPGGMNPLTVRRVIGRTWRDARISETPAPALPSALPIRGRVAALRQPDWLPFTDERDNSFDNLHPVFDALAAAGRGGGGLLRISVCRAPWRRVKVFGLAGRDPVKAAQKRRGAANALDPVFRGVRWILLGVLDLIQFMVSTGHGSTASNPRGGSRSENPLADPFNAERARLARVKGGHRLHLLVGIQVFAAAPKAKAATAGANDIAGGYPAVSTELRWRKIWRPATEANTRWIPESSMVLATVAETAALAGLAAEPSLYGLPAASSRHRPATTETYRTSSREPQKPWTALESEGDDVDPWGLA